MSLDLFALGMNANPVYLEVPEGPPEHHAKFTPSSFIGLQSG